MPGVVSGIVSAVSAIAGPVSAGLQAIGFVNATTKAVSSFILSTTASILGNSILAALFGTKASAQSIADRLADFNTAPPVHFCYGEYRATGTPFMQPEKGRKLYIGYILNSRESALPSFTLYFDKREMTLTGNAFDLTGSGASVTSQPPFNGHVNVWISRGDHTAPPTEFTTNCAYVASSFEEGWKTTDAMKGCTVIWLKLDKGKAASRAKRWKSWPPRVEVFGKWSTIYDPREAGHDPDDRTTWEWSDNHALCVRDALKNHPVRPRQETQFHETFNDSGPDICDETVDLNSGGSEPRYTVAGPLVFDGSEVEDQINPMMASGAANFIHVRGQIGYLGGVYYTPTKTLTYTVGPTLEWTDLLPADQMFNQLRVDYLSIARGSETASLLPWDVPGALAIDGGIAAVKTLSLPFCPSPTQAMRVRKITAGRMRREQSINGGELPPEAIELIGGSTVNVDFGGDYAPLDGVYEVQSIQPSFDPLGESGVALRAPATIIKHSSDIYDWDETTDEEEVYNESYSDDDADLATPTLLAVTSGDGVDIDNGGSVVPRFKFTFTPVDDSDVKNYEWQWRLDGEEYQSGGTVAEDSDDGGGKAFYYLPAASITEGHDARVRAVSNKETSDWLELTGAIYDFELSGVVATAGTGEVEFDATAPDSAAFKAVRIYRGTTTDFSAATRILNLTEFDPDETFNVTAPSAAGAAYFWITPVTQTGTNGQPDGPHSLTIL